MFQTFSDRGFSTLRFNFRGVGRSQGEFDSGIGELADAASALDWLQANNPAASQTWVAGYQFGAYIGMQLLMRRPETDGFISVSPPTNMYDFSFLAPCPASGIIVQGTGDTAHHRRKGPDGQLVAHRRVATEHDARLRIAHRLQHAPKLGVDQTACHQKEAQ